MLRKVHHINFVVHDLDKAIGRYESLFNARFTDRESLPERGAEAARFRLGDVWIVLLQPTRPDGAIGRHLDDHGEGFFLISYQVDDVVESAGLDPVGQSFRVSMHGIAGPQDLAPCRLDGLDQ